MPADEPLTNSMGRTPHPSSQWVRAALQPVVLGAILAAIAAAFVHYPVLEARALWIDDDEYVVNNELVRQPSWAGAGRFLNEILHPSTVSGYYQPLSMISLMLDSACGGSAENLRSFHRTSLFLHSANAGCVVVLIYLLLSTPSPNGLDRMRAALAAGLVGLLFAAHPLAVEPMAWVGERKTLLSSLFGFGCVICYAMWVRWRGRASWAASIVLFLMALLAKPTVIMMPVLLLLLDVWPLRRPMGLSRVVEKAPYLAIAAALGVIAVLSQANRAMADAPGAGGWLKMPLVICHDVFLYLGKIVWPAKLWPLYSAPDPLDFTNTALVAAAAGAVAITVLSPALFRRAPALFVGSSFFLVALLPTTGIVSYTTYAAADKYAYFPAIGVLLVLSAALYRLSGSRAQAVRWLATTAVGIGLIAEARASRRQIAHWADTDTLYAHVLALAPDDFIARFNHGNYLFESGRLEKSVDEFRRAVELAPWHSNSHANLGASLYHLGRIEEAMACCREALRLEPASDLARRNLQMIMKSQGGLGETIRGLRQEALQRPDDVETRLRLASALARAEMNDEAIAEYREALRIRPDAFEACGNLAVLLARQDRVEEAGELFERAAALKPDSAEAHNNLAVNLEVRSRAEQAELHYREAIRLRGDYADAYYNLSRLMMETGRLEEALAACREVLRIEPDNQRARQRAEELEQAMRR